jgi:hypothetical protein
MLVQAKKTHPALRHGAYSPTTLLPGEDPVAFEKLHQKVIDELSPKGALEDDIVVSIARLLWRKQNLATVRSAEVARARFDAIKSERTATALAAKQQPVPKFFRSQELKPAEREAVDEAAENAARTELGDAYELAELGEGATVDRLLQDLVVEERLDAMIDKSLKRLLHLRGLKSLPTASSSTPPQPIAEPQRIPRLRNRISPSS